MAMVGERTNDEWLRDLKATGQRNREATEALRSLLVSRLGRALAGRGVDSSNLEDFAQEGLIRILGNLESFRGDSKFTTWATVIALRVAYSEFRRARWKDRSLDELELEHWRPDPSPGPEDDLDRRSLVAVLHETIERKLTPRQRFAVLASLQGAPPATIAENMKTTTNTYYKLHHDARKKLRQGIMEAGYTEAEVRLILDVPSKER